MIERNAFDGWVSLWFMRCSPPIPVETALDAIGRIIPNLQYLDFAERRWLASRMAEQSW